MIEPRLPRVQWLGSALPALTLIVVVLAWEAIVVVFDIPPFLVPSPQAVARAMADNASLLLEASRSTLCEALTGFALSATTGAALGFVFTRARWIERSLVPYAVFLQTVPVVAIAPLLVLWFGVGFRAVAAASFLVAVFPVIASATAGLRSIDPELRALFRLYGARWYQRLVYLEVPAALPSFLTGLRSASGLAVIGAIVGEFVAGGQPGLGYVVMSSYRQTQTSLLFGAILCSSILGLVLYGLVSVVGSWWLSRWHASALD